MHRKKDIFNGYIFCICYIDHCAEANCSDLCVNEGGKAKCLCREGSKLIDAFRCTGKLFYFFIFLITSSKIRKGQHHLINKKPSL